MEVIVKGTAEAVDKDYNSILGEDLKRLDGVDCQDCFSDYMDTNRVSASHIIDGGYLEFKYEDGKLWSVTTYEAQRALTDRELEELASYTQGQWSDGIGEGFEQFPCNSEEDYISAWHRGQEITAFNNIQEIREEKLGELLDDRPEIDILNEIMKEYDVDNLTYADLGMDLKELYDDNHNYKIATLRAIRAFRNRGFEVTFKGKTWE